MKITNAIVEEKQKKKTRLWHTKLADIVTYYIIFVCVCLYYKKQA